MILPQNPCFNTSDGLTLGGLRLCNETVLIWQMAGVRKEGHVTVRVLVCHLEGKDFDP